MLTSLDIRDMLIIDRLSLAFQPGLNVLTGETGAGKSILLDALGIRAGLAGRADWCAQGAAQGEVTAVFDLPPGHAARAVLAEAGIEAEDDLILRRASADGPQDRLGQRPPRQGRGAARLGETLVELHGQHDDRGLLNPRGHRQLLDAFARATRAPSARLGPGGSRARRALAEAEAASPPARRGGFPAPRRGRTGQAGPRTRARRPRWTPAAAPCRPPRDPRRCRPRAGRPVRSRAPSADGRRPALAGRRRGPRRGAAGRAAGRAEPRADRTARGAGGGRRGARGACPSTRTALERWRNGCSPSARWPASMASLPDDLGRWPTTLRARLAALDGGARGLRACGRPPGRCRLPQRRRRPDRRAEKRPRGSMPPWRRTRPAEDGTRRLRHRRRAHRARPRRRRFRHLHRRHQPRRAPGPAEPHRLGRGTVALPAGAEGLPDR
jgi:DNA repair protein RecN (Recombination protein N)